MRIINKALLREELRQDNERLIDYYLSDHTWSKGVPEKYWHEQWECFQPSISDNWEYNLIIAMPCGFVRAKSIDFEFFTEINDK